MKKSELKSLIRGVIEEVAKMDNPCWKGYRAYGTKKKDGREVPNCVPVKEETEETKRFVVKNEKGEVQGSFDTQEEAEMFRDQEYHWDIVDTQTGKQLEEGEEEVYRETNWDMVPEGDEHTCEGDEFYEIYGDINADAPENLQEAEYRGRKVPLGKPMRGDVKKFKVYVRNPKTGNIKKVNFGDKKMRIKKSNPKRRKSFRARHNCANPGPRTKARYWSCRKW